MRKNVAQVAEDLSASARERVQKKQQKKSYEEKRRDRKAKWYRDKYKSDPEFRARVKKAKVKYRQKQKKLRDQALERTGRTGQKARRGFCPLCGQPLPKKIKPTKMAVGGKYAVEMFTSSGTAKSIGKSRQTLFKWIDQGVMPPAKYGLPNGKKLWTLDQVEVMVAVVREFGIQSPIHLFDSGFAKELSTRLEALGPLCIDVSKYTVKVNRYLEREHGH